MQSDYIISANEFMTDIFLDSYKLRGLYNGKIIQEGHPRTDLTLNTKRDDAINILTDVGVLVDRTKKIILYAPTWKGSTINDAVNDYEVNKEMINYISGAIDTDEYQVLVKPHCYTYRTYTQEQRENRLVIPANVETNELLPAVDILISDYSSIYFDYLVLNRPVLFFIPDIEKYSSERGIYFSIDEMPGPTTSDIDVLVGWINNIDDIKTNHMNTYQNTKKWACKYDDGNVSHRIVDIVFGGNTEYSLSRCENKKKKILFYPGHLNNNGVTEVFLTFVRKMDFNKFDVSVYCDSKNLDNINRIPKKVRVFTRCGDDCLSLDEQKKMKLLQENGYEDNEASAMIDNILERDFIRCFGNATFDYVVDFSGYEIYFPLLLSMAANARKYVWQHNDLGQDIANADKRELFNDGKDGEVILRSLKNIYRRYDKVISVSEALMKVNRNVLSSKQTFKRFDYVDNPVNISRIEELLLQKDAMRVPDFQKESYKFVTIGRLSPEKNHINLIRGFVRFCREYPNSVLYIIGPEQFDSYASRLKSLIDELSMQDKVILTGYLSNPFALMSSCDCFILPSLYEGASIAVLEARCLGLPVILSDYSTVEGACIPDGQLIIGKSEDDICNSMVEFVKGNVPGDYRFDVKEYNDKCFWQFGDLFKE
jgi:glycosyltransferase involved in cell wall biosynthesis